MAAHEALAGPQGHGGDAAGQQAEAGASHDPGGPARLRRLFVLDAVCSRLLDNLTGGAFLAGLALLAGATNLDLAWIAFLPFGAQVLQLPTVAILLRFRDRRRIVVAMCTGARILWVLLGALVVTTDLPSWALIAIVAASSGLAVISTAAWNWWMRDLIPPGEMAATFGSRLRGATIVGLLCMLVAGYAVDQAILAGQARLGYGILFALGGAIGLAGVVVLARTPHVDPPPSPSPAGAIRHVVRATQAASKRLVAALAACGVAVSFSLPFVAIYLLRGLGFTVLAAVSMAVVSQVAYLAGLRGWVHVARRHGDRPVVLVSLTVLALTLAGWAFTGWTGSWSLLAAVAVLHFLTGYALSGIELSTNNLILQSAPPDDAPAYLASLTILRALAAGLGVLASGWIWGVAGPDILFTTTLPVVGTWHLRGFQVLCLLAILACIAAIAALAGLRQPEQPPLVAVVRTIRREVNQMSSIAGMRAFIHAVSYSVEWLAAPFASRPAGAKVPVDPVRPVQAPAAPPAGAPQEGPPPGPA